MAFHYLIKFFCLIGQTVRVKGASHPQKCSFYIGNETTLTEYLLNCTIMFNGLPTKETRRLVNEYVIRDCVNILEPWEINQRAREKRLSGFLKRNQNFSFRKAEVASSALTTGFDKKM